MLPLNSDPGTGKPPMWFFHGGGGLGLGVLQLRPAPAGPRRLRPAVRGSDGVEALAASVPEMIDDYVTEMLRIQPEAPFHLVGWSYGGTVVQAVAEALDRRGHEIALVAVLDAQPGGHGFADDPRRQGRDGLPGGTGGRLQPVHPHRQPAGASSTPCRRSSPTTRPLMSDFESPVYRGDVLYFNAALEEPSYAHLWRPARRRLPGGARVQATHHEMHMPAPVAEFFEVVHRKLAAQDEGVGRSDTGRYVGGPRGTRARCCACRSPERDRRSSTRGRRWPPTGGA
ncbi:thioesterase domain-containing protein [Streptomyces sp. KL116D]|uniref:thioesterase domain-containing protein n=1 Tax=Streptomyces sp. KL116D TaxID=3045152 RepID=UPI0035563E82